MNLASLPVLAESRRLRLAAFAGLYCAQGIPWGMFLVALPTWLAAEGYAPGDIGLFIATVSFPWTLKLLTGPIMDRFSFLSLGRRRPWVLMAQSGIVLGCLLLSTGITEFTWLLTVGFTINFFAAWQDVAVDGLAIDILPEDERARANAFMFGGQIVGTSGSSAAGAWLLQAVGLGGTALVMSACVFTIALIPVFFRERAGEKVFPWTDGAAHPRSEQMQEAEWRRIFGDLFRVLLLPMSLLLVVVRFADRVAVGVVAAAFPVISTQELGFDATFYPEWNALAGLFAALFGILIAPFIDRITAQRALFWGLAFKALTFAGAGALAAYWQRTDVMIAIMFTTSFAGQWLTIASISLFMNICAVKVSASQFAVYMATANLALSVGSALFGPLDALLPFDQIFYVVALIDVGTLALLALFRLESHKRRLAELFPEEPGTEH